MRERRLLLLLLLLLLLPPSPPPPPLPPLSVLRISCTAVVDSKHILLHLDEEKPDDVVNESIQQVQHAGSWVCCAPAWRSVLGAGMRQSCWWAEWGPQRVGVLRPC